MSDLRDTILSVPPAETPEAKVFLEYHGNSPWAQEKVKAGLRTNPEAVAFMRRELAERARAKADYEARLKAEKDAANGQSGTENAAPAPAAGSEPAAADLRGPDGTAQEHS